MKLNCTQRHNTKNSKQIFPEKELRGLSPIPTIHTIHVYVSNLYIPGTGLRILLQDNMWTDSGNTQYKSRTDT